MSYLTHKVKLYVGVEYIEAIKNAMEGTWKSRAYWEGMKAGVVQLSALSPRVPKNIATLVDQKGKDIISGKLNIYSGPIKDQSGKVKVPANTTMSVDDRANMNWFVEGVIGKIQ